MAEPAGIVMPFAGSVAPEGYLLCDGSAVSRTDYATLFEVIGTTYGAGDGSTTFNVPDLSGRVVIGVSGTHALASTGGSETVTLSASELPAHSHEVPQHGHGNDIEVTTPELTHSITQPVARYLSPGSCNTGAGGAQNPFTSTNSAAATRSSNASVADHGAGACSVSGSIDASGDLTTTSTGGGDAHNNLQPYLILNYLISTGV